MINNFEVTISKIYSNTRDEENNNLKNRRLEISNKYPYILELEHKITKRSIELALTSMKPSTDKEANLSRIRNEITDLRVNLSESLVSRGYSTDYINITYKCNNCKDTGYINNTKCSCYKKHLVNLYYNNSDMKIILEKNNFDYFDFSFYSDEIRPNEPKTPRKNIEDIFSKAFEYTKIFDDTSENLLFIGNPGTGKTFLTNCIAKELLDNGFLVVYRTADDLIKNLKEIKFEDNKALEDLLYNCDLLIIDDLGTEQVTPFSTIELFNLLNKKLLKHKKMIVSTNLSLMELSTAYSERISSRLLGDFTILKVYGVDIRVNKNRIKNRR